MQYPPLAQSLTPARRRHPHQPPLAAGITRPPLAASVTRPPLAAGITRPPLAAGITRPPLAAGITRPPLAAGITVLALALLTVLGALATPRTAHAQTPHAPISTVRLFSGWNDVVYTGVSLPVAQALTTVAPDVPVVWEFDAPSQRWNVWAAAAPAASHTLTRLQPGGLYFLRSTREAVWIPRVTAPLAGEDDPASETAPPSDAAGDASDNDSEAQAPSPGVWQATLTRTTPLFSLEDTVRIDGDGNALVGSLTTPARLVSVSPAELTALAGALAAGDYLRAHPAQARSGCLSCFHYVLTLTAPNGDRTTIETDDGGLSGDLLAVVERLVVVLLRGLG